MFSDYININNIAKLISNSPKFLINIIYLFSSMVPRSKKIWLFSSWGGKEYLDNPKYIFIELNKQKIDVNPYWLVKDKNKFYELKKKGINVIYAYNIKGIWIQLRTSLVVFTHSVDSEYIPFLIAHRVLRILTWHGIPIKKIGYDDHKSTPRNLIRICNIIFPYLSDHLDLLIASSKADLEIYKGAFNISTDKIIITGYPRNDILLKQRNYNNKLEVIYMPTYRGEINSKFELFKKTNFNFNFYDELCKKNGINFTIKLHPVQQIAATDLILIHQCSNINILNNNDIYESLHKYDILITDFSGIYFDFLITGKPIIMAPFNMQEYLKNDRTLYYEYSEICPSNPVKNWDEVFEAILEIKKNNFITSNKYQDLQVRFHEYLDASSSRRALDAIKYLAC